MTPEFRIKLSKEQEQLLKEMEKDIQAMRAESERLKRLGADTTQIDQMLEEAERLRKQLLEEFGSGS